MAGYKNHAFKNLFDHVASLSQRTLRRRATKAAVDMLDDSHNQISCGPSKIPLEFCLLETTEENDIDDLVSDHTERSAMEGLEATAHSDGESCSSEDDRSDSAEWVEVASDDEHVYKDFEVDCNMEQFRLDVQLRNWAVTNSVPSSRVSSLLKILHPHFSWLPKDARTLLATEKKNYVIKELAGGLYHHFGLAEGLRNEIYKRSYLLENEELSLQINFDGLPIYKSTATCFWPILCLIHESQKRDYLHPFIVGLWSGSGKPNDANSYLRDFVEEAKSILSEGFVYNKDKVFKVVIKCFVCNTPARCFVKKVKAFNGYFGCDFCQQPGSHFQNRQIYEDMEALPRTDQTFNDMVQPGHHHGESLLKELGVRVPAGFHAFGLPRNYEKTIDSVDIWATPK